MTFLLAAATVLFTALSVAGYQTGNEPLFTGSYISAALLAGYLGDPIAAHLRALPRKDTP